jgi:hypothetical protein
MEALVKYLEKEPMTNIKALYDKLIVDEPEETYDPSSVLE